MFIPLLEREIPNNINTKESHNYDTYRVIKSNETEDDVAYKAARRQANKGTYCVAGQSCLDVSQAAVNALLQHRGFNIGIDGTDRFGFDELIPNQWINDLGANARDINYFSNNPPRSVIDWIFGLNKPRTNPRVTIEVGPLERIKE